MYDYIYYIYRGLPPYANQNPMKALSLIPKNPSAKLGNNEGFSSEFQQFVSLCLKKSQSEVKIINYYFLFI